MPVENGTADNAADFYTKLIVFLEDNDWVNVWEHTDGPEKGIVVRGPGLSGNDQVYIGMALYQNAIQDSFWIEFVGMTGIIPISESYRDHINVTPRHCRMFLDIGECEYWFVANGRRFMAVAKISTVFEAMYAGLFLPYGTPLSYPYPLFIGGSAGQIRGPSTLSWRDEDQGHHHFLWPYSGHTNLTTQFAQEAGAWFIDPAGSWRRVNISGNDVWNTWGPRFTNGAYETVQYSVSGIYDRMTDAFGGTRILVPSTLVSSFPSDQTWGVLDGAHRCQGVLNSAENTITIDGTSWLVVQDVYRTEFDGYWCMRMD